VSAKVLKCPLRFWRFRESNGNFFEGAWRQLESQLHAFQALSTSNHTHSLYHIYIILKVRQIECSSGGHFDMTQFGSLRGKRRTPCYPLCCTSPMDRGSPSRFPTGNNTQPGIIQHTAWKSDQICPRHEFLEDRARQSQPCSKILADSERFRL